MKKYNDIITSALGTIGITVSVQDLNQIVNLVLLVLSIINILYMLTIRIIERVKSKDYKNVSKDIEEAKNDLEKLKKKGE